MLLEVTELRLCKLVLAGSHAVTHLVSRWRRSGSSIFSMVSDVQNARRGHLPQADIVEKEQRDYWEFKVHTSALP